MNKKVLVAVAWPYVNGDLHPGHLAGYLLPADIFARYHRLKGNDVLMVSGSDCHGTPTTIQAVKEKTTPEEIVKKYHQKDVELFSIYNLSYDLYTKTDTQIHKETVWGIFINLLKNGFIEKGVMKQYYSPDDDKFLPDRYVEGECPHCHAKDQRSDQCEDCGKWLKGGEIINPKSKLTGREVILKDTEHYFLNLEKFEKDLEKYVDSKKDIWRKWAYQETKGWLKEGLERRAITRDIDWGIELPVEEIKKLSSDKQLSNFRDKRIYVWFEAVIGYLSASVEWTNRVEQSGEVIFHKSPAQSSLTWRDWWENKDSEHYYFIGQDNLVFHTLMWPAQLIATKKGYTLPYYVVVSKFLGYEGKKFSKSRNWTIDSTKLAHDYGVDIVRYYIASILPENKETDFAWDRFKASINNELVANLGNFINRTLKFVENKYDGKIEIENFQLDEEVKRKIEETFKKTGEHIEKAEIVDGLNEIMSLSAFGNKYFNDNEIWKSEEEKAKEYLINLVNIILNLSVLLSPYLPSSAKKISDFLGSKEENSWAKKETNAVVLALEVQPLFPKIEI